MKQKKHDVIPSLKDFEKAGFQWSHVTGHTRFHNIAPDDYKKKWIALDKDCSRVFGCGYGYFSFTNEEFCMFNNPTAMYLLNKILSLRTTNVKPNNDEILAMLKSPQYIIYIQNDLCKGISLIRNKKVIFKIDYYFYEEKNYYTLKEQRKKTKPYESKYYLRPINKEIRDINILNLADLVRNLSILACKELNNFAKEISGFEHIKELTDRITYIGFNWSELSTARHSSVPSLGDSGGRNWNDYDDTQEIYIDSYIFNAYHHSLLADSPVLQRICKCCNLIDDLLSGREGMNLSKWSRKRYLEIGQKYESITHEYSFLDLDELRKLAVEKSKNRETASGGAKISLTKRGFSKELHDKVMAKYEEMIEANPKETKECIYITLQEMFPMYKNFESIKKLIRSKKKKTKTKKG